MDRLQRDRLDQVQRDLEDENQKLKWLLVELHRAYRDEMHPECFHDRAGNLFDHNDEIVALFAEPEDKD